MTILLLRNLCLFYVVIMTTILLLNTHRSSSFKIIMGWCRTTRSHICHPTRSSNNIMNNNVVWCTSRRTASSISSRDKVVMPSLLLGRIKRNNRLKDIHPMLFFSKYEEHEHPTSNHALFMNKSNQENESQQKYLGQNNKNNNDIQKDESTFMTSTSPFVTHFIAKQNNTFTIEKAIESVLIRPIPKQRIHNHNDKGRIEKFALNLDDHDDDDIIYCSNTTFSNNEISDNGSIIKMSLWNQQLYAYEQQNPILQSIDSKFRHDPFWIGNNNNYYNNSHPRDKEEDQLSPAELVALGSVWFLPFDAPRDPSLGGKPVRVEVIDLHQNLVEGDYLRVHHTPRRFPIANDYDWGKFISTTCTSEPCENIEKTGNDLPGVIVHHDADAGYMIINKPPGVPVHPTVDNLLENVAGCVGRSLLRKQSKASLLEYEQRLIEVMARNSTKNAKTKNNIDPLIYVATPQRLDQNTSGLAVVATKKSFASYFAKLLRNKTDNELKASHDAPSINNNIQKKYRCLVCISPDTTSKNNPVSMWDEVDRLKSLAENRSIIRHYLEPSFKVPRTFSLSQNSKSTWLECLLKVDDVGTPYPVVGSQSSSQLCQRLWGNIDAKPKDCIAVVEVEVEILTGRTHQIRGQMSQLGFPLCGDVMYGGSLIIPPHHQSDGFLNSEFLSLQCCELSFRSPCSPFESKEQNKFRLDTSWWSAWLEEYSNAQSEDQIEATTNSLDKSKEVKQLQVMEIGNPKTNVSGCTTPFVQLSPGKNKYVVIKAGKTSMPETEWYIRSSSPIECGGPYHADVARSLVEDLKQKNYDVVIMGGGRIDFSEKDKHAHVYGFSYGFGKGDHEFVSMLIEKHSEYSASFDESDSLY